jgi:DNA-binding LacI/PurR family transcriptional regulator
LTNHKWQEIADAIQGAIREGRLGPGDRVPAERELSIEWGVSRMTVHRALQELQRGGWVVRRRGQGTVIAGPEARRSRRLAMVYFSDATVLEAAYLRGVRSAIPEEIDLLICVHHDDPKREARLISRLTHQADGIVLIGTGAPENDALIGRAAREGLAVVCMDRVSPGLDVDSVITDNYAASLAALRTLTARGHRRIAHFTADLMHVSSARERYEAYLQVCRDVGQPDPSRWVRKYPVLDTSNHTLITCLVTDALAAMRASGDAPTAAFCVNEGLLEPLLDACDELGLNVPGDLDIISFNDSLNLMRRHERAVGRLVQRPEAIGRIAVEMLLARLDDPSRPCRAVRVPADLHPAATDPDPISAQPPPYPVPSAEAEAPVREPRRNGQ